MDKNTFMKSLFKKFIPFSVLLFSTILATANAYSFESTDAYYIVGVVGLPSEDCYPFTTFKECHFLGTGCTDNVPGHGMGIQLYGAQTPIEGTDRFLCVGALREGS